MVEFLESFILLKCTTFGRVHKKGSLQCCRIFPLQAMEFSTGTVECLILCRNSKYSGHQYSSYLSNVSP